MNDQGAAVVTDAPVPAAIATEGLSRSFGTSRALSGFSFEVPYGKVSALVGPNGSGKTTLLLILAGLLAPDDGQAAVGGYSPVTHPYDVHRSVGWMPDFFGVYEGLTLREYLELFGAAYGLEPATATQRARELLALVHLESRADAPVHTLSRGQKQRLGFARVLVHQPDVLLLDEPASGLDPRARIELRDLVRAEAERGAAVLVSSHILTELEEMSDLVVFADGGRCRGVFPIKELPRTEGGRTWRLRTLDPAGLAASLERLGATYTMAAESAIVVLASDELAADLLAQVVGGGQKVIEFAPHAAGLEGYFMSLGGEER